MGLLDQFIVKTLPLVPKPIVAKLSAPYIAGDSLQAAIETTRTLNQQGFCATLDILGEFVTNFDQALEALAGYKDVVKAIRAENLDANISIKPTSFGLLLDQQRCEGLISELMDTVAEAGNFMRLDMEDSPCTTMTIDFYKRLRQKHGMSVGIVLQAYMHRTLQDIEDITSDGKSHFRLCKGIYVEPEDVAIQGYQAVRENYLKGLRKMFEAGAYVGIATHDDYLVTESEKIIKEMGLSHDQYEFQMLLGVREQLRDQIKAAGHKLRIYIPYGRDWYGYSVRRLKENPALAGTMFKAIFFNK